MEGRSCPVKGAPKAPETWGASGDSIFFFLTATVGVAEDAAPPECERNPAEGGCFASLLEYIINKYHVFIIIYFGFGL